MFFKNNNITIPLLLTMAIVPTPSMYSVYYPVRMGGVLQ